MSPSMEKARIDHQVLTPIFSGTEPDRNTLADYQIHLAAFFGISVPECLGRGVGTHPEKLWVKIPNYFCLSAYDLVLCHILPLLAVGWFRPPAPAWERLSAPHWAASPVGVGPLPSAELLGLHQFFCVLCFLLARHRKRRLGGSLASRPVPSAALRLAAPGHEPGLHPGAGRAHTGACQRLGGPLLSHGTTRGGVRSCQSVDVGSRHCACRAGTLAPGRAGVGRRSLWGLGAPKPLP